MKMDILKQRCKKLWNCIPCNSELEEITVLYRIAAESPLPDGAVDAAGLDVLSRHETGGLEG